MRCRDLDDLSTSDREEDRRQALLHAQSCARCRTELEFHGRIREEVKALRPAAPDVLPEVLQHWKNAGPRRLLVLRAAMVLLAASLVVAVLAFLVHRSPAPAPGSATGLLNEDALARVQERETDLEVRHESLRADLSDARSWTLTPLREEIRFVEDALDECRQALASNEKHRHLRTVLLELSERRNQLLGQLAGEPSR